MFSFFFFNDTATTEIYTLSLHDALPISIRARSRATEPVAVALPGLTGFTIVGSREVTEVALEGVGGPLRDRKSTRLNSSHGYISYAVFCLKKKKINKQHGESRKKKRNME